MKDLLYWGVSVVARIHNIIMQLNDSFETSFTDKELHFLVIGLMGLGMIFVVYPFFKALAKSDHVMVIAWIYVFTLIIVISFAIEIGQKITSTGEMEFADIMSGVLGFWVMFALFALIRAGWNAVTRRLREKRQKNKEGRPSA